MQRTVEKLRKTDPSLVPRNGPSSVAQALQLARRRLAVLDPGITATALLGHVLGLTRAQLLARPEVLLTPERAAAFEALVERAALGEPLAYLTGRREFYGLEFEVDPRVLDVGTGSGCIAIALAVSLPQAAITATDISAGALELAARNAQRNGVSHRIDFVQTDLLDAFQPLASNFRPALGASDPPSAPLTSHFPLLTANLPYIDTAELRGLPVSLYEPGLALDGGPGGLVLIERLLRQAPAVLAPGGLVLLEIGAGQGPAALALARAALPGASASIERDLAGLDRLLVIETR